MIIKTPDAVTCLGPGVVLRRAGVNIELAHGRHILVSCINKAHAALVLETIASRAAMGEEYLEINEAGEITTVLPHLLQDPGEGEAEETTAAAPVAGTQLPCLRAVVAKACSDALCDSAMSTRLSGERLIIETDTGLLVLDWTITPHVKSHYVARLALVDNLYGKRTVLSEGFTREPAPSISLAWHVAEAGLENNLRSLKTTETHDAWEEFITDVRVPTTATVLPSHHGAGAIVYAARQARLVAEPGLHDDAGQRVVICQTPAGNHVHLVWASTEEHEDPSGEIPGHWTVEMWLEDVGVSEPGERLADALVMDMDSFDDAWSAAVDRLSARVAATPKLWPLLKRAPR